MKLTLGDRQARGRTSVSTAMLTVAIAPWGYKAYEESHTGVDRADPAARMATGVCDYLV
ncbi:hypothetical protein [Pseudoruegeria sp. HB172150]|uniref:hypothetical protein n=1 Tax=Pseudoruegeria sp. HB172150 TaxID=2721164 RepID=UPI0015571DE3|nr:hypothetical protein [Pseudoruegeria sp. HB172150]